MLSDLHDSCRAVQRVSLLSAPKSVANREEQSFASGRTGIGAFNSHSDDEDRRDWQGDVKAVSTLIAEDLRERTWDMVELDSSEDVEGAGEGGEKKVAWVIDGRWLLWGTVEVNFLKT